MYLAKETFQVMCAPQISSMNTSVSEEDGALHVKEACSLEEIFNKHPCVSLRGLLHIVAISSHSFELTCAMRSHSDVCCSRSVAVFRLERSIQLQSRKVLTHFFVMICLEACEAGWEL